MFGMFASGICAAQLLKRVEPKLILLFATLAILCCLGLLIALFFSANPTPLWFFITSALLYLFSGIIFPAAAFLAVNSHADKATASSIMSFINMVSAMLTVIIMGYLPVTILAGFIIILVSFITCIALITLARFSGSRIF